MSNATQASNSPRILVFDSGVGGLSVAREILQRLPSVSLVYASDNGFFPYGTKGEAELIARVDVVMSRLLQEYPVDILVIACNTASTLTLPHLRSRLSLPIVGVVPAIKPAAKLSKTGVIGLLATPATVARPYTYELIREYAPQCDVISLGTSELVQIAEQKLRGETIDDQSIAHITAQLMQHEQAAQMDVLVLACTHFPLLKAELAASLPAAIQLIDSGEAIARRVEYLLEGRVGNTPNNTGHTAVFTKKTPEAERLIPALHTFGMHTAEFIDIE
ncbi:glutamate racemase [Cellvibrio sp. pealriver]|uniref:glutamate racemase n=1 Tax=Cellvibrio sp. pealriver TaxID=1622269 RepID=UPI0009E1EF88|nr:glutamate racemase [Cellvibrio sp. pealriver]